MSDLSGEFIDGRYQLERQIATGGMASIYEAIDTRLDRKVAVKIMHPHLAQDEAFVERFIREAKAAAALTHPNIVAVQDQGWNQSGVPAVFLVMELIEGHTLRDYLFERGKFDIKDAINYLVPILSALAAAHAIGIVHRDIKPENILISKEGRIKIGDFGLARGALLGTTMTAESSIILGSVSYLSPEQVQRGIADSRSDVYASGIVAFEMLTGERPFLGETPIQIAYKHVNERVPLISTKRNDIPPALDQLISKATSSNPDDRPRDAGEFLSLLQKIQSDLDPLRKQMSLELDLPVASIRDKVRDKSRSKVRSKAQPTPTGNGSLVATSASEEKVKVITAESRLKKRQVSKRVRRNRYIALILAIAVGAGGWYILIGPGSRVVVPSIIGGTQADADAALTGLGLTSFVVEKRFDEEIAEGKIIASVPQGGAKISAGESVKLIISKGPERYLIPNVRGLTPEAALEQLIKLNLKSGTLTEIFSRQIPVGFVVLTLPAIGKSVKRDTVVDIVVSKGIETIQLDSYLGKSGEQGLNELNNLGFNVDSKYEFSESVLTGGVISQIPAGGAPVPKGSKILLVISKGSQYVFIPNLYSLEQVKAQRALQDLDLKVIIKKSGTNTNKKVTDISPKVGTKVKRGSTVTITVG